MASLCRPSSPNSLQLRFGLECRKHPPVRLRLRLRPFDRLPGLVFAVGEAADGERKEEPRDGANGSPDSFAGWSTAGSGGDSSPKMGRFEGILGAALAGFLFAAGVTFATLSISNKSADGAKQEMKPLTAEQERLISSDDTNGNVDQYFLPSETNNEDANKRRFVDVYNMDNASLQNSKSADIDSDANVRASDVGDIEVIEEINDSASPEGFSVSVPELSASVVDISSNGENLLDLFGTTFSETEKSGIEDKVNITRIITSPDLVHLDNTLTNHIIDHYDENIKPAEISNYEVPFDSLVDSDSQFDTDLVENIDTQVSIKGVIVNSASIPADQSFAENDVQLPTKISTSDPPICNTNETDPSEPYLNLDFGGSEGMMLQHDTISFLEGHKSTETGSSLPQSLSISEDATVMESNIKYYTESVEKSSPGPLHNKHCSISGIPAPCYTSAANQLPPGKVLVPALVDRVQGQALTALQILKVIEADVQPGDICIRREYARWLVVASSNLSRSTVSKIYPAMYIENVTELAFDDITPDDPDFPYIQGLAEAGLISSKLSGLGLHHSVNEEGYVLFAPERPVSRQDLISWKMVAEKTQLPQVDRNDVYQCSGYIDIHKIDPEAWPALVADLSSGDQSITALAFGCTRLFQPDKPVTKAQAAIALASGDAAEVVSEELARIEAESLAETAVNAHTALLTQFENDLSANFEKELAKEREKAQALEVLAEEVKVELDRLRTEREEEHNSLTRGHAAVESEMEALSRLRNEVEEQLQSLMSNKLEISFQRDKINKLRQEAEDQNQVVAQLKYELEVEKKALSLARAWAEDEAKRVREHAKAFEEAKLRWEGLGYKGVADGDFKNDAFFGADGEQSPVVEAIQRGDSLVKKLKAMAAELTVRSSAVIQKIIEKIISLITVWKQQALGTSKRASELWSKVSSKAKSSVDVFQENASEFSCAIGDRARRIVEDCKEGVDKFTQKFRT